MNILYMHKLVFVFALTLALSVLAIGAIAADAVQLDQFHAGKGVSCADCHGDNNQRKAVPMIKCLECHNTNDVAAATADLKPTNPHDNRHFSTEMDCNYCHHQHKKSENFCVSCHSRFEFVVP